MNDNQFSQSSCNSLSWKATVPSHKIDAVTHSYIVNHFFNDFLCDTDRALEKVLQPKVVEILK